jgi:hypothetical protein
MPSTATDLRYGRRGGGWLPAGYTEHREDVHCPVCDGLLTVGQDMHQACRPDDLTLFELDSM